jgi:Helix-turn-helix domain
MRKISVFAVAAAVVATGLGVWAASTTDARVAPSMDKGIEPFYLMMNAKEVRTAQLCARRDLQAVREAQQEMTVRDTAAATGIKESTLRQLLKGLGKEGEIRCGG